MFRAAAEIAGGDMVVVVVCLVLSAWRLVLIALTYAFGAECVVYRDW